MNFRRGAEKKSTGVEKKVGIDALRIGKFLNFVEKSKTEKQEEGRVGKTREIKENVLSSIQRREIVGKLGVDDTEGVLSKEEKESYNIALRDFAKLQSKKDYAESCMMFLGMAKNLDIYKALYATWNKEYNDLKETDASFKELSKTENHLQDFMRAKSLTYITEVSMVMREQLVHDVFVGKKEELTEQETKKLEEVNAKIEQFITVNKEELRVSSGAELDRLFKKFQSIFSSSDLKGVQRKTLRALFDDLVTNIVFESLSKEEMDVISNVMVRYVNSSITEEEWDALLQKELRDKAKGDLKEHIEKVDAAASAGSGISFSSTGERLYTDVSNMAKKCGVYLQETGEPGVYKIRYGAFNDPNFSPTIKINSDGSTFELRSQYVDKDKETYQYGQFQFIANWQLLEHELEFNKDLQSSSVNRGSEVNSQIDDEIMIKLAEKLFGFGLGSKPLNKQHKKIYGRFAKILLSDKNGSLVERIKKFEVFINQNPENNAVKLMNVLRVSGSQINTMDNLLEMAGMSSEKSRRGVRL